jgi:hypothetical protein
MRRTWLGGFAMIAVLAAGCTRARNPVQVVGPVAATNQMVGRWLGDFMDERDALGNVVFELAPGATTAYGDVLMLTPQMDGQGSYAKTGDEEFLPVVMTIKFVLVSGTEVSGDIDPYIDPSCGCKVETTFRGAIDGDRISGTFVTRGESGRVMHHGQWNAARAKDAKK